MGQAYYLGVDGGGTGCRARLSNGSGAVLGEGMSGSANVYTSYEVAWLNILEATHDALAAAGLPQHILGRTCAGLGLAGAVTLAEQHRVLEHPHPFGSVRVLTDAHAAVLGAFAGEDGAVLILGTGSCGMVKRGEHFRSLGGLGFPASDSGSGAWLGLTALREALLAWEGLREDTPLTRRVIEVVGSSVSSILQWQQRAHPGDFSSLAPLVFEAHDAGDNLAGELIRQSAAEAEILLNGLLELGAERFVLMGGLARHIERFLAQEWGNRIVAARGDALDGAVLMARLGIGKCE
jgi:glucosamine kinase